MTHALYTEAERHRIVQGYQKLDGLTDLLKDASRCRVCNKTYPERPTPARARRIVPRPELGVESADVD